MSQQILNKITEDELELCELFFYPIALAECLFSNMDNLTEFDEDRLSLIRRYQAPLLSFDFFVDVENDYRLKGQKAKFQARKNVSDIYALGARKWGKSIIVIVIDLLLYIIYAVGERCSVSSVKMEKLEGILHPVKHAFEVHPFVKIFYKKATAGTSKILMITKNNVTITSVNTNPTSTEAGKLGLFGPHPHRHYAEEFSLFTSEAMTAARDSTAEVGCIERFSGMTNFNVYSPAGQIFYDKDYKSRLINYPQFVNPLFTKEDDEMRIKEFNGKESPEYKMFVLGEVISDNVAVVDTDKIPFNRDKPIIHFEISDKNFINFRELIVVNRPDLSEIAYLAADVSDINITEIMIWYKWNKQYHYRYKITLHGLDDTKQKTIFKWLINKAGIDYTGIDCGDALGRVLVNYLETEFDKHFIYGIGFNEKLPIEIELDKKGNPVRDGNDFVYKEEWISIWSVRMLLRYMYDGQFDMNYDTALEKQLTRLVAIQNSNRIVYKVKDKYDHTFQALQVFATMLFKLDFENKTEIRKKNQRPKLGIGVM